VSSDDYYLEDATFFGLPESARRMYLWEKDHIFEPSFNDWRNLYDRVYVANAVLETLAAIEKTQHNAHEWDNVKGQALFFRAHFFLQGVFIWGNAYDAETASTDLGIPLRLDTDYAKKSTRSTVEETYMQVIKDLTEASELLPDNQIAVSRPSKTAAYGLLARTYLAMRDYERAGEYADLYLKQHDQLMDFNALSESAAYPIKQLNEEVVFESRMSIPRPLLPANARIILSLYNSYHNDDLRKSIFFVKNPNGTFTFKGSYEGALLLFSGVSTNEMYLVRAECHVRNGNLVDGLADLRSLMTKRWRSTSASMPYQDSEFDEKTLLGRILSERRKELLFRGLRWMDIKRLNKEGYDINLSRTIDNQQYTLPANDLGYALPIPDDIIAVSGIEQN